MCMSFVTSSAVGQKQGFDNPLDCRKYGKMKECESSANDYLPHCDKQHQAEKNGESVSTSTMNKHYGEDTLGKDR